MSGGAVTNAAGNCHRSERVADRHHGEVAASSRPARRPAAVAGETVTRDLRPSERLAAHRLDSVAHSSVTRPNRGELKSRRHEHSSARSRSRRGRTRVPQRASRRSARVSGDGALHVALNHVPEAGAISSRKWSAFTRTGNHPLLAAAMVEPVRQRAARRSSARRPPSRGARLELARHCQSARRPVRHAAPRPPPNNANRGTSSAQGAGRRTRSDLRPLA